MFKRILLLCAALLFCLSCAACKEPEPAPPDSEDTDPSTAQTEGLPRYDFDLSPYIMLGDYKTITVKASEIAVTAEILDSKRKTDFQGKLTDRAIENGDTVIIDYEGRKDGVPFSGGTASGFALTIGSGQFIPGFESGLIGVFPGQTIDLNLRFPDNYSNDPEMAGEEVIFTVKVHYIATRDTEVGEITDHRVSVLTAYETVAAYEEAIKEQISESLLESAVWDAVENMATYTGKYPQYAYDFYYNDFVNYYTNRAAAQYGLSLEEFLTQQDATLDQFYGDAQIHATDSVKYELLLHALGKAEDIVVSDAEYDGLVQEMYERIGAANNFTSVEDMVQRIGAEALKNETLYMKLVKKLCGMAVIEDDHDEAANA